MAIDFTMPAHVLEIRDKVRAFIKEEIEPAEAEMRKNGNWRDGIIELRRKAQRARPVAPAHAAGVRRAGTRTRWRSR